MKCWKMEPIGFTNEFPPNFRKFPPNLVTNWLIGIGFGFSCTQISKKIEFSRTTLGAQILSNNLWFRHLFLARSINHTKNKQTVRNWKNGVAYNEAQQIYRRISVKYVWRQCFFSFTLWKALTTDRTLLSLAGVWHSFSDVTFVPNT